MHLAEPMLCLVSFNTWPSLSLLDSGQHTVQWEALRKPEVGEGNAPFQEQVRSKPIQHNTDTACSTYLSVYVPARDVQQGTVNRFRRTHA